jgi:hypothetical protein
VVRHVGSSTDRNGPQAIYVHGDGNTGQLYRSRRDIEAALEQFNPSDPWKRVTILDPEALSFEYPGDSVYDKWKVLLDFVATLDLFGNQSYVYDIEKLAVPVEVVSVRGVTIRTIHYKAKVPNYGEVYYDSGLHINILSAACVRKRFDIFYDNDLSDVFHISQLNGSSVRFHRTDEGLYVYDQSNREHRPRNPFHNMLFNEPDQESVIFEEEENGIRWERDFMRPIWEAELENPPSDISDYSVQPSFDGSTDEVNRDIENAFYVESYPVTLDGGVSPVAMAPRQVNRETGEVTFDVAWSSDPPPTHESAIEATFRKPPDPPTGRPEAEGSNVSGRQAGAGMLPSPGAPANRE